MTDTLENKARIAERPCPGCGAKSGRSRGRKNGFEMYLCQRCGTLYASRIPDAESAEDYDSYYEAENLSVPEFINRRLDEIVAGFAAYRKHGRLLDVGCGAGSVLEAAARAGWEPTGTDISRTAVEHIRGRGFDAFCGELADARYPDGHFDVAVASEVLEHVPHPQAMVREIARVLRPGGLLWATTPHGRGVSARTLGLKWSAVSPPEHLHLFSLSGIKKLITEAGFRRVKVKTQGVNPFEIFHGLRHRSDNMREPSDDELSTEAAAGEAPPPGEFNRVASSYRLNEFLTESPSRRVLKNIANGLLSISRTGDSLKIRAVK